MTIHGAVKRSSTPMILLATLFLPTGLVPGAGAETGEATSPTAVAKASPPRLSTPADMASDLDTVPCEPGARRAAVRRLFERMGARPEEIRLQEFAQGVNVVLERPGATEEVLYLGAHYDRAEVGCGAVDNWTGIVALAHLYRSLRSVETTKTLVFGAFDREEIGLKGSWALIKDIPKEELSEHCAMINLDSLGMTHPHTAKSLSTASLVDATEEVARREEILFSRGNVNGISDSDAFKLKGIPAVSIIGLAEGWEKVIHTEQDQADRIHAEHVHQGYRLALALALELDAAPCGAWREGDAAAPKGR